MRDLQKEFCNCIGLMDEIDMDYGNIVDVTVNRRAKRRWGQCRRKYIGMGSDKKPKYYYTINISEILLDERVPLESLKNTIIHEILHTCPGCANHGPEWKRRAAKVKKELGYDIKRTDTPKEKGVGEDMVSTKQKPKYAIRCKKCGQIIIRERMSKIIKYPEYYRCGICGSSFEHCELNNN